MESDPKRAAAALGEACEGGIAAACESLGSLAAGQEAFDWLVKGCDLELATSCVSAGKLAATVATPQAQNVAAALYERGCERGAVDGCAARGDQLQASKDTSGALAWYEVACMKGHAMSCSRVASFWSLSTDSDALTFRIDALDRGCAAKDAAQCVGLGGLLQSMQKAPEAFAAFSKACALTHEANECTTVGVMLRTGTGTNTDEKAAEKLLAPACANGDKTACYHLALIEKSLPRLRTACEGPNGLPDACNRAGLIVSDGAWSVAVDFAEARRLYGLACTRDHPAACVNLAYIEVAGEGGAVDYVSGRKHLEKACAHPTTPSGIGCFLLGNMYDDGLGVPRDEDRATSLYREALVRADVENHGLIQQRVTSWMKSCDEAVANGRDCHRLGILHEHGFFDEPDAVLTPSMIESHYAQAAAYYRKACTQGHKNGCYKVARLAYQGHGEKKPTLAVTVADFRKGCQSSHAPSCAFLGAEIVNGKLPGTNNEGRTLVADACKAGFGGACTHEGLMFLIGKGVKKSPEEAEARFKRACELEHGRGCWHWGEMEEAAGKLAQKENRPVDAAKAKEEALRRYDLACEFGYAEACTVSAATYMDPAMPAFNPQVGENQLIRGCRIGSTGACFALGKALAGSVLQPNRSVAMLAFKKACTLGHAESCKEASKLEVALKK
jgi:TPR repeat protein